MTLRIGIDVGGTNTDAALLDQNDRVVAKAKKPTTPDITSGMVNALSDVLSADYAQSEVDYVMLGTTHCTNALTERRNLNQVGVIRIGAPATLAVRPLLEWPEELAAPVRPHAAVVEGGHEFDGREIHDLNESAVRQFLEVAAGSIDSLAVTSVFSPVVEAHEQRVRDLAREILGSEVPVSLSAEIGSIGLLERENATVMNALLKNVIEGASRAFRDAMDEHGLAACLLFGQNDGTLMSVDYAERYPIFTVASGPANSIRGAAYLSGLQDAIVVDVGGTTTDVGVLKAGFPRESSVAVEIGGVKTNFRMPDLLSIGLGGGSVVHSNGVLKVGPDSVGYGLTERARIFGGDTLTASDVAVALGRAEFGTEPADIEEKVAHEAWDYIVEQVELAVDRMKTGADSVPVVVVGGGSVLVPNSLAGASEVARPEHFEVANAIGAAIAQVSGEVDRVYSLDEMGRNEAVASAKSEAKRNAVAAGADAEGMEIVQIEEIPLAYLPGTAVRIRARAAGPLST